MDADDHNALLLFRVGPVCCCAPSRPVAAVVTPPPLHRPPGADALHPGVFRHVSGLVRVLDLRIGFGTPAEDNAASRIIVADVAGAPTGFAVDEILDVLAWPEEGWGNLPPLVPRRLFRGTLEHGGRLYLYTEFARLNGIDAPGILHGYLQGLDRPATSASVAAAADTPPSPAPAGAPPDPSATATDRRPAAARPAEPRSVPAERPAAPARPSAVPAPTRNRSRAPAEGERTARPAPQRPPERPRTPAPAVPHRPTPSRPAPSPPVASRPRPTGTNTPAPRTHTDSKHSPSSPSPPSRQPAPPPESASGWLLGGALLLVLGLAGWLGRAAWVEEEPPTVALSLPTSATPAPVPEAPSPVPETRQEAPAPADRDLDPARPAEGESDTPGSEAPQVPTPARPAYRAEIHKDSQGITLVLHQPREAHAGPSAAAPRPPAPAAGTAPPSSPPAEAPPPPATATSPPPPRRPAEAAHVQREIVHIVVRGDTLWDIAARYVHDPFRYPELARLSRIRNPDLIYPGDRVRILVVRD